MWVPRRRIPLTAPPRSSPTRPSRCNCVATGCSNWRTTACTGTRLRPTSRRRLRRSSTGARRPSAPPRWRPTTSWPRSRTRTRPARRRLRRCGALCCGPSPCPTAAIPERGSHVRCVSLAPSCAWLVQDGGGPALGHHQGRGHGQGLRPSPVRAAVHGPEEGPACRRHLRRRDIPGAYWRRRDGASARPESRRLTLATTSCVPSCVRVRVRVARVWVGRP